MIYKVKNVILNISTNDFSDGMGESRLIIEEKYKDFFEDCCRMEKLFENEEEKILFKETYEPLFSNNLGEIYWEDDAYYTHSADIIIAFMSYLFSLDGEHEIDVTYDHPYWAIHDSLHALNDESGCTIYVSWDIEKERILDTFKIMIEKGWSFDYEMLENIETEFKERFKKDIYLLNPFYYDLLEYEDEEE